MSRDRGTLPDIPPTFEQDKKAAVLNGLFFLVGIIGTPFCVSRWQYHHSAPWLIAIGVFAYFLISSITEPILRSSRKRRNKGGRS